MQLQIENRKSIFYVRNALVILSCILFIIQLSIDSDYENLFANIYAISVFIPACFILISPSNSRMGPALTATAAFLTVASNSLAPMLATLSTGNVLTVNLFTAADVYFHRFFFGFSLIFGHVLAKTFLMRPVVSGMNGLGRIFKTNMLLPVNAVWALGFIGFITYLLKHFSFPAGMIKLLDGFGFLMWAPFVLILYPYNKITGKSTKWHLLLFYIVQVGVSFAGNSRMAMIGPIALVAAAWLVTLLMGHVTVNAKFVKRLVVAGAVGGFLAIQLVDVSTAILIQRAYRSDRGIVDQLNATVSNFMDKKALSSYRKEIELQNEYFHPEEQWKEGYTGMDFLDRFIQIKYDDNSLNRMKYYDEQAIATLRRISGEKILALLPDPLLKVMGVSIDKEDLNSYSTGDLIENLTGQGVLGEFRTGSVPIHAYGLFGWWYPLVMMFTYCVIFAAFQGLTNLSERQMWTQEEISTLGLVLAFKLFTDISLDGVQMIYGILVRGIWQTMIIYFFSLLIWKLITKMKIAPPEFQDATAH